MIRFIKVPLLFVAVFLVCPCFTGCEMGSSGGNKEIRDPKSLPRNKSLVFGDMAVPESMKYQSESISTQTKSARWANLVYKGKMDMVDLVAFYRENMSQDGWTFNSQNVFEKNGSLHFSKNAEVCEIFLEQSGSSCTARMILRPLN